MELICTNTSNSSNIGKNVRIIDKRNRMRSRFDEKTEDNIAADEPRQIQFRRLLSKKKHTPMLRLIILLAAALWAYYYFTNVN